MPYKDPIKRREYEKLRKRKKKAIASGAIIVEESPAPTRRRCAEDGCSTILSMYNDESHCAVHMRAIHLSSTNLAEFLKKF